MGLSNGIKIGRMKRGRLNSISDVKGVTVGHFTLAEGPIQTGVTAIKPHQGNLFREKLLAACQVLNGFGKSVGLVQVEELGTLETPILLTNTLSVGRASTALVKEMLDENPEIGDTTGTVNPLVFECNDGYLNDIRALAVEEGHVREALSQCATNFKEGAVGAGRGMKCFGLKGGIGTASRQWDLDGGTYHLGVLVLTNHGCFQDLLIAGKAIGQEFPSPRPREADKGSVITIIATDLPLSSRQLKRLCRRAVVGLSKTGSLMTNGSGEIVLAFSTANRIAHNKIDAFIPLKILYDEDLDLAFQALAESVEEAVLSSLFHAETVTGRKERKLWSLKDWLEQCKSFEK
ncbi:S58 family peptidase [Atopobacter sp. AH10]|uniref:DmpA family aminopeptidase n=1 Tax=Atopobacter sp. AH10 TaxID=2315861 RepID=UPI000EF199C2|nr:P1 family peptidase [Atopobacter sp. AH10]RLK63088.1 S58 family peptidase [Atopobacter sp. AH10]